MEKVIVISTITLSFNLREYHTQPIPHYHRASLTPSHIRLPCSDGKPDLLYRNCMQCCQRGLSKFPRSVPNIPNNSQGHI